MVLAEPLAVVSLCVRVSVSSRLTLQSLSAARQLTSDQNSTLGLANPQYKGLRLLLLLLLLLPACIAVGAGG